MKEKAGGPNPEMGPDPGQRAGGTTTETIWPELPDPTPSIHVCWHQTSNRNPWSVVTALPTGVRRESPSTGDPRTPAVDQPSGGTHHCAQPNAHTCTHTHTCTCTHIHICTCKQSRHVWSTPPQPCPSARPISAQPWWTAPCAPASEQPSPACSWCFLPVTSPGEYLTSWDGSQQISASATLSSRGTILRQLLHSSMDGWSP